MKRKWVVEYKITGTAYAEVETEGVSEEDAIDLAWARYLAWDVDDLNVTPIGDEE